MTQRTTRSPDTGSPLTFSDSSKLQQWGGCHGYAWGASVCVWACARKRVRASLSIGLCARAHRIKPGHLRPPRQRRGPFAAIRDAADTVPFGQHVQGLEANNVRHLQRPGRCHRRLRQGRKADCRSWWLAAHGRFAQVASQPRAHGHLQACDGPDILPLLGLDHRRGLGLCVHGLVVSRVCSRGGARQVAGRGREGCVHRAVVGMLSAGRCGLALH